MVTKKNVWSWRGSQGKNYTRKTKDKSASIFVWIANWFDLPFTETKVQIDLSEWQNTFRDYLESMMLLYLKDWTLSMHHFSLFFLHSVFSNDSSNFLLEQMHSHIGCICLAFLHCAFSNVSSNLACEDIVFIFVFVCCPLSINE